jgi:phage gp16-like protein
MTISRSNIADRIMHAEWLVQFAENWAGLSDGVIKRSSRMANINEVRRMVIAYAYYEIGLSQMQTAAVVGRKHPAVHHQLTEHNEALSVVGNTNRQLNPTYARTYKMFCDDVAYHSRTQDAEYLQREIARLQMLLNDLQKEAK